MRAAKNKNFARIILIRKKNRRKVAPIFYACFQFEFQFCVLSASFFFIINWNPINAAKIAMPIMSVE